MKKIHSILLLVVIFVSLVPGYTAQAQTGGEEVTVEIQPEEANVKDLVISSGDPYTNFHSYPYLGIGEHNELTNISNRSLIEFDLTGLPYDMTIVSAQLVITVAEDHADNGGIIDVYTLQREWEENNASWMRPTWDPYVSWSAGGVGGAEDVLPDPSATLGFTSDMTEGTQLTFTFTTPEVFADMRKNNYFGVMLRTQSEVNDHYFYYPSSAATAEDRPKLILTYITDEYVEDPGWLCVADVYYGVGYTYPECVPTPPVAKSPYTVSGGASAPWGSGKGLGAALLLCEPYPRCINDYPIYYHVKYKYVWNGDPVNGAQASPTIFLQIPGMSQITLQENIPCGSGTHGSCMGTFEGTIEPGQLPANYSYPFTIGLAMTVATFATLVISDGVTFELYLSTEPFDQNCTDTYYTPLPETFDINEKLETPLGINGTPPDYQIYETVIDQEYMVRVANTWLDGEAPEERLDAAVSFDGETWMTWDQFAAEAICIDVEPIYSGITEYQIIYFTATTETFYIRVNDNATEFADNGIPVNNPPYQYTIGVAFEIGQEVPCETQFTYDPQEDWIASINLQATADDVTVEPSEPFVAEEWYAIEVADGTWNEPNGSDRIDMEFLFARQNNWSDLDANSDYVYCENVDSTVIFLQAPGGVEEIEMHLRVNDQDNNFANNEGVLSVNIYHTTYTHIVDGCELSYQIGEMVSSDSVEGTADNGKEFAVSLASSDLGLSVSYGLEPGGVYMLETVDGPWWTTWTNEFWTANQKYYDMQVRANDAEWSDFETWSLQLCTVEIDGLGHKRMYFQVPVDGGGTYSIRVAAAGPFTRGSEGWELYAVTDLGYDDVDGCSSYDYSLEAVLDYGTVDSTLENGGVVELGPEQFQDKIYAIHIHSAAEEGDPPNYLKSGWYEGGGDNEEHDNDLQLSLDNGDTWETLPNSPAVLCYFYTPLDNELVMVVRKAMGAQWRMRVNSETFSNNSGVEIYTSHEATITDDPWFSCFDEYQKYAPAINPFEWIPVGDEEGIALMPDNSYSAENDPDGDGIIEWGAPALAADHTYAITTIEGPWDDGDTADDHYDAQLSSDGGQNWFDLEEAEGQPNVECVHSTQLGRYWTVVFNVVEGQQWKIRVGDTETDIFADNSGNLAFELWLVNEAPIDPGDLVVDYDTDDTAFDVCVLSLVRPQDLEFTEIVTDVTVLGNYVADWIQYTNRSVTSYFAWCPRHTELIINAIKQLQKKEPLATVEELNTITKTLIHEVAGYDWDESGLEKTSLFAMMENNGKNAKIVADDIFEHILPSNNRNRSADVWSGADLISFGDTSLPDYYYTCNNVFAGYLPTALQSGVCFAAAYWKETEAAFWVQLTLDISALFVLFGMVKGALQSLIYMMTGVRPWTKSGALAGVDKLVGYFERQERRNDANLDSYIQRRR